MHAYTISSKLNVLIPINCEVVLNNSFDPAAVIKVITHLVFREFIIGKNKLTQYEYPIK